MRQAVSVVGGGVGSKTGATGSAKEGPLLAQVALETDAGGRWSTAVESYPLAGPSCNVARQAYCSLSSLWTDKWLGLRWQSPAAIRLVSGQIAISRATTTLR